MNAAERIGKTASRRGRPSILEVLHSEVVGTYGLLKFNGLVLGLIIIPSKFNLAFNTARLNHHEPLVHILPKF